MRVARPSVATGRARRGMSASQSTVRYRNHDSAPEVKRGPALRASHPRRCWNRSVARQLPGVIGGRQEARRLSELGGLLEGKGEPEEGRLAPRPAEERNPDRQAEQEACRDGDARV